jgi:SAM-dependent methyltransferase
MFVPDSALKYIALQRGDCRGPDAALRYERRIRAEFDALLPVLPKSPPRTVIDLGCGLCGIDVLLAQHYPEAAFGLVDRDEVTDTRQRYGFGGERRFYSSTNAARALLLANGVEEGRLHFKSPEWFHDLDGRFDLILSLASWCFHYPAKVYLASVDDATGPGSMVVVDVRIGTGEKALLERHFGKARVVNGIGKAERLIMVKP